MSNKKKENKLIEDIKMNVTLAANGCKYLAVAALVVPVGIVTDVVDDIKLQKEKEKYWGKGNVPKN